MMGTYGPLRYLTFFIRYWFGIHCLVSGANYFIGFSKPGAMLDPATISLMDGITTMGVYTGVKTLEFIVGICVLTGWFLPLALVLEFPVSVFIFSIGLYQSVQHGPNIHLLTSAKEVGFNAFLFAGYAGYYLRILSPRSEQRPIWNAEVRAEAAAFYREQPR